MRDNREVNAGEPGRVEILPVGEQAVLVRFGATIDEATNARVLGAVAACVEDRPDWLVDLVPAYASLLVVVDPLAVEPGEAEAWLRRVLAGARLVPSDDRRVDLPVLYDPAVAPDLVDVAREVGLSVAGVAAAHAAREYRVFMLGFKPGFPYMGVLDDRLVLPRLATPRTSVAAGSVAIAGRQTGVYPVSSPGGWRILGRTPLRLFDAVAPRPFLLSPGDRVRFLPIDRDRFDELEREVRG